MMTWQIVLVLLACFGMTLILVHSKILNCPRKFISEKSDFFNDLLKCSMCTGWWVGLYYAFIMVLFSTYPLLFYFFTMPFASSGVSFLLERLSILIDDKIPECPDE